MTGKLKDLTMNLDGTQNITITINEDFREMFDELSKSDVNVEIKKYSQKRSLDASARAWVLIDAIAERMGMKKTEVYRNAIKDIGGVSDVVCVKDCAVETLCRNWSSRGQGWMTESRPSKKIPGYSVVTLWYGSSVYTKKQMSDLINSLVQDGNELGIPTMSPAEQEKILTAWGKKVDKYDKVNTST